MRLFFLDQPQAGIRRWTVPRLRCVYIQLELHIMYYYFIRNY